MTPIPFILQLQAARKEGIRSIPALQLLLTLHLEGESTIGDLCRVINVSNANITGIVDTLERANVIIRKHGTMDRRTVWLSLTASGTKAVKRIMETIPAEATA